MEGNSKSNRVPDKQNPQVDLSQTDHQAVGLSQAVIAKRDDALKEPDDDLHNLLPTSTRVKSSDECGASGEYVELIIEGYNSITIKKQTLRDTSPYFATLLKYNEERISMIPPTNVHLDCYMAVLHGVFSNVPPAVDVCNMWDFFVISRYFLIKQLEDTCSRIIRQSLPILTIDKLCRLWRNANALQYDYVKKWFLAGIVRHLGLASQSAEFLELDVEEMLSLLRDDGFLPLFEADVYTAIITWCEYDPENRMTPTVLEAVLGEVVWDHYDSDTIRQMATSTTPPLRSILEDLAIHKQDCRKPKRAVERHLIFGHEAFVQRRHDKRPTRELLHYDCLRGTLRVWNAPAARTLCTRGSWRYAAHDLHVGDPSVIMVKKSDRDREADVVVGVNLVDGQARVIENGLSGAHDMHLVMGGYDVTLEWCYQTYCGFLGLNFATGKWERRATLFQSSSAMISQVSSCLLQLPEGERIAHLLSFFLHDETRYYAPPVPNSIIGFTENHKDFFTTFTLFPALPSPRRGAAIVQCGTLLFVTGGSIMTDDRVKLAKQCFRLDLTTRDRWERIGDLRVPRVDHCMFVQSGRVFVYGGSMLDAEKKKVARMLFETYDPYADLWTAFDIPLVGGHRDFGSGTIGDSEQSTYCMDLGSFLDQTKYRDIDEPIQ